MNAHNLQPKFISPGTIPGQPVPTTPSSERVAVALFVAQTVAHARTLPLAQSLRFLQGALLIAEQQETLHPVRAAYQQLQAADARLAELAGSPLKVQP